MNDTYEDILEFMLSNLSLFDDKETKFTYIERFLSELYDCDVEIEERNNYTIDVSLKKKKRFVLIEV